MDAFARDLGYTVITMALMAAVIYLAARHRKFARICKILLLGSWLVVGVGAPLLAVYYAWGSSHFLSTVIGAGLFLIPGTVPFFYIGWPELVKAFRNTA